MTGQIFTAAAHSVEETEALARALAATLKPGDGVLLVGDLGAGKTQFVQGVAAALGARQQATSPTFGLVNVYDSPRGPIVHVDTYRLKSIEEFRGLALDALLEDGVGLIEWGDAVARDFGWYDRLEISVEGDARRFTLTTSRDVRALPGWSAQA